MPQAIYIEADWDEKYERMQVKLEMEGQQYIERLTRHQWRKLIYDLKNGGPLRLGGLTIEMTSGPKGGAGNVWQARVVIRDYLYRVDEAFESHGHTRVIRQSKLAGGF